MFKNLFSKKEKGLSIKAPVSGKILALEDVPDDVFSAKIMGDGIAVEMSGDRVCAPCDGVVALVAETKHAIALRLKDDTELLIHIGIDTVGLKGEGFHPVVKGGDTVSAGDLMMTVDKDAILEKGLSMVSPIIVCNSADHPIKSFSREKVAEEGSTELFSL